MTSTQIPTKAHQQLYDTDFVEWIDQAAVLLKQGKFDELDIENLIEEVEDLGKKERRELQNRLAQLLLHLLKWQYQPERRSYPQTENAWDENSWARSINFQRNEIKGLLEDSPSLYTLMSESMDESYRKARKWAAKETPRTIETFPESCPYTESEILDDDFWPDSCQ